MGSPFLWLLSFGEAKESDLLSGNPRRGCYWPRAATERAGGDTKHLAVYQFAEQ
jgi:hypothetical protein